MSTLCEFRAAAFGAFAVSVTGGLACGGASSQDLDTSRSVGHGSGSERSVPDAGVLRPSAAPDAIACATMYSEPPEDCDATDPASWEIDCDGDGVPGAQMTRCDPELTLMFNASAPPGRLDCDDQSADVFQGAAEGWGDGRDSDCDGLDAPTCEAFEAERVDAPPLQQVGDCEGSGVYLWDFVDCPNPCANAPTAFFFALANSGTMRHEGPTELRWRDERGNEGEVRVDEALLPGEVSAPIRLERFFTVGLELTISGGAGECALGADSIVLEPVRTICIR
jgi:hypothetical protein